jgi:sugar phosphate isomerase/epimerase
MDVMQADEIMPLAKANGLTASSSFIEWSIVGKPDTKPGVLESNIEMATKHGLKYLVFGYIGKGFRETADILKATAERSNRAGELCKKAGIELCYHHHSFEFQPLASGETGMDVFIREFDPKLVSFEIDVFWCAIGGWDPIQTLKRLKGRVSQVHLKDLKTGTPLIFDEGQVPKDAFKEVGAGSISMKEVLAVSKEIGVAR